MKYRILIIIIFFLSFSKANSQWLYHFPNAFFMPAPGPEKYYLDNQNIHPGSEDMQLMNVDVQLGTSFFSSFTGSPMMSSYIAPTLNFNISSRFNLSVGGVLINNHTSGFNQFVPVWNRAFYLEDLTPTLFCLLQEITLLIINYWFTGARIQVNFQQIIILLSGSIRHHSGKIILTVILLALSISSLMRLQLAHRWNTVTDLILTTTGSIPTDNLPIEAGIYIRLFFGNPVTSHIGFNIWDQQA